MKKSEFWQRIWIPIAKRIPEPNRREYVLIWNPIWKEPMAMDSLTAHAGAKAILEKQIISEDRIFSHWCKIEQPVRRIR